jgi:gluconokinase
LIVVVMGVTGSGKTTVGGMLAAQLGWDFADADEFYPAANVEKMTRGIALTDQDREPWLVAMQSAIKRWIGEGKNVVLACSALKKAYRERLTVGPEVRLVYLKGNYAIIAERLRARHGHFATEAILAAQFVDLEEPEGVITIDVGKTPEEMVVEIRSQLGVG